jgi:hypothetical protein
MAPNASATLSTIVITFNNNSASGMGLLVKVEMLKVQPPKVVSALPLVDKACASIQPYYKILSKVAKELSRDINRKVMNLIRFSM